MPLGNPIRKQNESRIVSVLATEGQTVFTVQGGYIINHISVFRNGVRLSNSEDFTAGDGSTVTLNNAANIDDRIEFHIFDRFTVQNAIVGAASSQTISGDLVVNGKVFGNLQVSNVNTGIVTATELDVNGKGDISGDLNVAGVSTFTGAIDANGDLDVDGHTNLDNVSIAGVATATGNIHADNLLANSNLTVNNTGNPSVNITSTSTTGSSRVFFGDPSSAIVGQILYQHNGDYMQFFTAGTEKLRIDSTGRLLIGTTDIDPVSDGEVSKLIIKGTDSTASASFTRHSADAGGTGLYLGKSRNATIGSNTIVQDDDELGRITFSGDDGTNINTMGAKLASFVDGTPGENDMPGRLVFFTTPDGSATPSERMRIDSSGQMGLGMTPTRMFEVKDSTGANRIANIRGTGASGAYLAFLDQNTTDDSKCRVGSSGGNNLVMRGDTVQFATGAGTEFGRFDSSGRLLLGHTSSQQSTSMLQVSRANNSTIRVACSDATATNFAALDLAPANSIAGARIAAVAVGTFGSTSAETAYLKFETRNAGTTSEKLRITSSGSIGVGEADPSPHGGEYRGIDVGYKGSGITGRTGNPTFTMRSNIYYDGSNWKYGEGSTTAGLLSVGGAQLIFSNAPSGTAGATATITERMRMDADGRLLIAATSGTARLHIKGSGGDGIKIENSGGTNAACIDLKNTLSSYVKEYRIAVAGSDGAYGSASSLFVRDQTAGATRLELATSGDLKVNTGDIFFGTAGKGICLGNTANVDANTLEDYEEGTFTPRLGPHNNHSIYENGTGQYTKVGDSITYTMSWQNKNCTSFPTNARIEIWNLPFTFKNPNSAGEHQVLSALMMHNVQFASNEKHYFYSLQNNNNMYGLKSRDGTTWIEWSTADWNQSDLYYNATGSFFVNG